MAHPVSQDRAFAASPSSPQAVSPVPASIPLREGGRASVEGLKRALVTDRLLRGPRPPARITPRHRKLVVQALLETHGPYCWLCDKPLGGEEPTLDHIVPRSKGGRNAIANLRLAHHDCNQLRADGPIPELLLTERAA